MTQSLRETIYVIISDLTESDINKLNDNTRLKEDLGCDSLDKVDIALAIEDVLDVDFKIENIMKFKTIGDIFNYINKNK